MDRILITGATGNVGEAVIRYLIEAKSADNIVAGVRTIAKDRYHFPQYPNLEYIEFDFAKPTTFDNALKNIDRVFLLRPPNLADVQKYFQPLMEKLKATGVQEIVFLSVQGAEKSSIIPHHKIEQLIRTYQLDFVFLRPSYFMQNLTTTLLHDIQQKRQIILPAGKAKFNWVDVENIGEVAAIVLTNFQKYKNRAYELTGYKHENFYTVAGLIRQITGEKIMYKNVNPVYFFYLKWLEGLPFGKIMVMLVLHFLPRFQEKPAISDFYEKVTGQKPTTLREFIEREKDHFIKPLSN